MKLTARITNSTLQEVAIKIEKIEVYKCDQCTNAFLDASDLTKHVEQHHNLIYAHLISSYVKLEKVDILTCDDCTQGFLNNKDCFLHKVQHIHKSVINARQEKTKLYDNNNIEKPYKCSECDYRFVAKSTLEAHLFVHQPFPHICFCGIGYYELKDLKGHQKLVKCKPKVEETKPLDSNKLKTSKEIIKVKLPFKKKKRILNGHNGSDHGNWTLLPTLPLEIDFKRRSDNRFQCPICGNLYKEKAHVDKHYRSIHRNERPYLCNICHKTFTQRPVVENHLLIHSGVKSFQCQYCEKMFYDKHSCARHERTHTGYKPYECVFCDKSFSDPSAFARHERIHTGEKRYICDVCPKAFTDNSALYVHKKRHRPGPRDFACDKCTCTFHTKSGLRLHVETVHQRIWKFQCDHCKKFCSSKMNLTTHIKIMHTTNKKTYKCHICFKNFAMLSYLRSHISVVHDKVKNYTCEICCKQYYDKRDLARHALIHTNNRTYECNDCSKKYYTKVGIFGHIVDVHLNIYCKLCRKRFSSRKDLENHKLREREKCEICEKQYFCKGALDKHIHTIHKSLKFVCDHCGDIFKSRHRIVMHIGKYHGKQKFKCDHCGLKFGVKCDLRSHMKSHLRMFHCKICHKVFYSSFDLKKHKNTLCSKEKHDCEICGKSFSKLSSLSEHKKKHLPNFKKMKCPLCEKKYSYRASLRQHFKAVHTEDEIF